MAVKKFSLRGFDFFDCINCTLRFVSPRFLAKDIYENDYFQGASHGFGFTNYEKDKIASQGYLMKFLDWIRNNFKSSNLYLIDVGAANGYFVKLANEQGFKAFGIEISSSAVEWAAKLGRPVAQGTLETLEDNRIYDVITVLDVLEHIPEPLIFLKIARSKIADNGILLINVPNLGSFFSKVCGKKWHAYLPPEHWIYFNKKSITKMLEMAGFEIIFSKSISKSFTIGYLYLTIANSPQVPKIVRILLKSFNKIFSLSERKSIIYLPLFDNLAVLARPTRGIKH
jgi:2-polyprenyl-3-methyl-5-hydroxy-6-metoxy-1,4-benzoquinol methylase